MSSKQASGWSWLGVVSVVCGAAVLGAACSSDDQSGDIVSSRSYRGHENDVDITNFVNVYPATVGTRLDDCQTCHRGGTFTEAGGGRTTHEEPLRLLPPDPEPRDGLRRGHAEAPTATR